MMTRSSRYLFPAIISFILAGSLQAATPLPSPPSVPGSSYLLMDANSGRILAAENENELAEPASITKIMTTYVVVKTLRAGQINLDDQVLISEKAWRAEGSRMFIEVNKLVSVSDLLKGVIVQSGNDASIALAEHIAGSEESFAELMNHYAIELGMLNSHFVNSTGLPHPDHRVSAVDVARLTRALVQEFPDEYQGFAEKEFTFNNIRQNNRNDLLFRDDRVDGVKTGHTDSAGYCLVASAVDGEQRLISVVMGTTSERARADASMNLLNYGFRYFESHRLYRAGDALTQARIWLGEQPEMDLGLQQDLHISIPRGSYEDLEAFMDLNPKLTAPINETQQVGVVRITLDGKQVATAPLYPLASVAEGSFFQKLSDHIRLLFE